MIKKTIYTHRYSDSKVHGPNMGPTWVLSAPYGPHVGPMNFAIIVFCLIWYVYVLVMTSHLMVQRWWWRHNWLSNCDARTRKGISILLTTIYATGRLRNHQYKAIIIISNLKITLIPKYKVCSIIRCKVINVFTCLARISAHPCHAPVSNVTHHPLSLIFGFCCIFIEIAIITGKVARMDVLEFAWYPFIVWGGRGGGRIASNYYIEAETKWPCILIQISLKFATSGPFACINLHRFR